MITKQIIMDKFLETGLKQGSALSYTNGLLTLVKRMAEGDLEVLNKPSNTWFSEDEYNEQFKNLKATTRRNYLSSLIGWMKVHDEVGTDLWNSLSRERDDLNGVYERIVEKGEKTAYEKEMWVDAGILKDVFSKYLLPLFERLNFTESKGRRIPSKDKFDESELKKIKEFVILAFYLYPFYDVESNFGVMRNDLAGLRFLPVKGKKFVLPDPSRNYFISRPCSGTFIMNDYKSQRVHGQSEIKLPKMLATILRKYSTFMGVESDGEVFKGLQKYQISQILQKLIGKYTGKCISTQLLRKIYISSKFGEENKDRSAVANSMMHSVDTQTDFYTKK